MKQSLEFLKRHSLIMGIVLIFLFTWPIDLANAGVLPFRVPFEVSLFIGWGVVFASVIMTGLTLGRQGVVSLLKRYLKWKAGWRWYLAAFCLVPSLWVAGVFLNAALTHQPADFSTIMIYRVFGRSANIPLIILPWFLYEIITNGEEIGWRGYVLPRLQANYSPLASALILGLIWGFWHFPRFLSHLTVTSFGWFMIHTLASSIIMAWIYNRTKGSLLMVTLAHAANNTVGMLLPVANSVSSENMGAYITIVCLEVLTALVLTAVTGSAQFSRMEPKQTDEGTLSIYRAYADE